MEEELKDYEFYKLVCNTDETIYYIGSTSNMKKRIKKHKSSCSNINCKMYNCKIYNIIRANGGFDNFKFINLGNIKNVTKNEAHQREQEFINLFKPNMNTNYSYLTEEDDKKQRAKRWQNYAELNKQNIAEYGKKYRETHKEQIATRTKEYREKHKEQINEKISENRKEKITCECGSFLRKSDLTRHKRTKKHINLMKNNELQILN